MYVVKKIPAATVGVISMGQAYDRNCPTGAGKEEKGRERKDIDNLIRNYVPGNQAHAFSCKREVPTANSVLDQGELDIISPAGGLALFG